MENTGIQPVMPIGNMGYGDGFGYGGGWMWIIVLFALMGGGFGGWNNRDTNVARIQDVYASNDNQTLNANVRDLNNSMFRLGNGISDATFALNNTVVNGFNNIGRDIANGTYVLDKAVTDTRFAGQQNANMIAQAIANDGEKTRALIVQNKIEELQGRLAEKDRLLQTRDFEISQYGQTRDIIGNVRPFPIPAYPVGNPYGTGCNCSCGCYNA